MFRPLAFTSSVRVSIAVACFFVCLVSVRSQSAAVPEPSRVPPGSQLSRLEQAAEGMSPHSVESVRLAVSMVTRHFLFGLTDRFLRDRLAFSELAYLTTHRGGIPESVVAPAVNKLARAWSLPKYLPLTTPQIDRIRLLWTPMVPTVLRYSPPTAPNDPAPVVLSPIGGVFLGLAVFQQKITNPFFQTAADQFLKATGSFLPGTDRLVVKQEIRRAPDPRSPAGEALGSMTRIAAALDNPASPETAALLAFLSELGIAENTDAR